MTDDPKAIPRDRALPIAALASSLACAAVVGLLELQHRLGRQHFRPEPFLGLMVLSALAMVASIGLVLMRVIRRRFAWSMLGWLVVALLPAALWTTVGFVGYGNWSRRHVPRDFFMELAKRAGASIAEAEIAWVYPQRAEGRHVVMAHRDLPEAASDVARMDVFLESMANLAKRPLRDRVHWTRGTLLGLNGFSMYGLASGSMEPANTDDGLLHLDRHEAAHALMSQWIPPMSDVPTVLSEGWAQAIGHGRVGMNASEDANRRDLLDAWRNPERRPLRDLFTPAWYHQDSGPVYYFGDFLAWYLVSRHGADRYLDLCAAIRPDDPDAAFRRVYGKGLDEIERDMDELNDTPIP